MRSYAMTLTLSGVLFLGVAASAFGAATPSLMTYQGQLADANDNPLTGTYAMLFTIYDDPTMTEGHVIWQESHPAVDVTNGLFSVILGAGTPASPLTEVVYDSPDRWLGIKVGTDPEIAPRSRLSSVAYSQKVTTIHQARGGIISGSVTLEPGLKKDLQPEAPAIIMLNGVQDTVLKLAPPASSLLDGSLQVNGSYSRVGSILHGTASSTHVNLGVACTTGVSGFNRAYATIGGGAYNVASGDSSTVGGGVRNHASDEAATIGGGVGNEAGYLATVGGGTHNVANANRATIGGGSDHTANALGATVGGGVFCGATGQHATVAGGNGNFARGAYATVPGGYFNDAVRYSSFAAGYRAKANHGGTFVWADSTDADFTSTGGNQFLIRAGGGVGINTNSPQVKLDVDGDFALRVSSYAASNGLNNNINIGARSFVRITGPAAVFTITGIAEGYDGKMVILYNTTTFAMTIANENVNSTAANRILTMTGADDVTVGTGNVTLIYDAIAQRWIVTALKL